MHTKTEIFKMMNENPAFHLATIDENKPRVRGMLLFKADENGIIFHTSNTKDVYKQIKQNPNAELCFQANGTQIRVNGILEEVFDEKIHEEILNHSSRQFLRDFKTMGIDFVMCVFILKNGTYTEWSMETNFDEKEFINL